MLQHLAQQPLVASSLSGEALQSLPYSIPRGHGMAALHPSEHPWNGAQIFQTAAFGSPRWPRADACCIEFLDRRGLLEVFNQVGILRDVAAIDAMGLCRHF